MLGRRGLNSPESGSWRQALERHRVHVHFGGIRIIGFRKPANLAAAQTKAMQLAKRGCTDRWLSAVEGTCDQHGSLSGDDFDSDSRDESGGSSEGGPEQELLEGGEGDEVEDSDGDSDGGTSAVAEAAAALLRDMGFLASEARLALRAGRWDVQAAVAYLVD
jgi:hypothetical protein